MKRSMHLPLFLIALAPSVPAAQEGTAVLEGALQTPTAESVIERYFAATNLRDSFEDGKMLALEGTVELEGMGLSGTFEQYQTFPPRTFLKMSIANIGDVLSGYDGEVGWSMHPMTGAHLMEGTELFQVEFQTSVAALLKSPDAFEVIEFVGTEEFEGRQCHKLKLVAKPTEGLDADATRDIRTSYEYYELDTGYLYASVQTAESPMGKVESTILTTEYQEVDGIHMPTRLVQKSEMVNVNMTVTSAEYSEVDLEKFALPKAIRTLKENRKADPRSQTEAVGNDR